MKSRYLFKNKFAVSGVIEALLLVALVAIIISTIQLLYVPQIMEEKEAEHMDEVANQFSFLKAMIDLQSATSEDVPISSPITLGNSKLPFFVTMGASGQLSIIDKYKTEWEIKTDARTIPLTSIIFEAYNYYFIDQIYVLEGGGIIVNQPDGESMRVDPPITIENGSKINIKFYLPLITSVPGKNLTAHDKTCFVRTNYSSDITYSEDITYFEIHTKYLNAWNESLCRLLEKYIDYGYVTVDLLPLGSPTYVRINRINPTLLHMDLTVVSIGAQTGAGVVIQSS